MLVVLLLILYCGEWHVNMSEVKRGRVVLVGLFLFFIVVNVCKYV
jgi:hypothetical protein